MSGPDARRSVAPSAESEPTAIWDVVRRAQNGDSSAFGQLYDTYVDPVYRFLYFRVGDRGLAEDFTSETFVRALRRLDTLSFRGRDPGAWLMTIARNLVLDHLKSSRHRFEVVTADLVDLQGVEGPESEVVSRVDGARLLRHLDDLGAEQRECLVLRFLHDLSVSETAQVMGKNDGAIKALQHRALKRLAALIRQERS